MHAIPEVINLEVSTLVCTTTVCPQRESSHYSKGEELGQMRMFHLETGSIKTQKKFWEKIEYEQSNLSLCDQIFFDGQTV